MTEEVQPLVIDFGSGFTKAGFACDAEPKSVFPSAVGLSRISKVATDRSAQSLIYPIEKGIVTDWKAMETLLKHTFYNELRVYPENNPVLLTEAQFNTNTNREKMTEIMFETFGVPGLYVANQAVLDLYAYERSKNDTYNFDDLKGLVVTSGKTVTHAVPIYGGKVQRGVQRLDLGGRDITNYLKKALNNYSIDESEINVIKESMYNIKDNRESMCYVAADFESELQSSDITNTLERNYELSNGEVLTLNKERFIPPEVLFKPSISCLESVGIHEIAFNSIQSCDVKIRKELYGNILLSGGNTLFDGFQSRLFTQLRNFAPETKLGLNTPENPQYSSWKGGSELVKSGYLDDKWITRAEYDEAGPTIINRKCF